MKRNIINIDEALCNGCGQCVTACAEGAIKIVDGKAKLVSDTYCDGLGACLGECPTGALTIVQREAAAFDEDAVAAHVGEYVPPAPPPVHACPGSRAQVFHRPAAPPARAADQASGLGHWPVQIRLIAPHAPFLAGADIVVAADCVPVAWPGWHDAIRGKVAMIGCPKFDDTDMYVQRFAEIFAVNDVRSVTVLVMQVPCCQSLPLVVQEGMRIAGRSVPLEKVVIGLDGGVLMKMPVAV